MTISRLPQDAVRQLGSTLAILTPITLLKELVENAIDAGATFVDIIVSSNAFDKIVVRDNGHGISRDDLDSLGRSGYTSKISSFDELDTLGGQTLGFRGVALASINTVADITLTTRTANDTVATTFQLLPDGGVSGRAPSPAPVGTTVCATNLFSRTPVRVKLALKESTGNLIKMKELVQSYALARPHIKLHLRILRGQTITWSYAPKPEASVRDAAVQLFGTELASNCILQSSQGCSPKETAEPLQVDGQPSSQTAREDNSFTFEAYLPGSFADVSKVTGRAFFSVDSRPVSATKGTFKKFYALFKAHLSRTLPPSSQHEPPRSAFIRLNICCPPGSYDANIEPTKDDVLFHDENRLINHFESFLLSIYQPAAENNLQCRPQPPVPVTLDARPPQIIIDDIRSPSSNNQNAQLASYSGGAYVNSQARHRPAVAEKSCAGPGLPKSWEASSPLRSLHSQSTATMLSSTPTKKLSVSMNDLGPESYPTPPDLRSLLGKTRQNPNENLSEMVKLTEASTYSPELSSIYGSNKSVETSTSYRADQPPTNPDQDTIRIGACMGHPTYHPGQHLTPFATIAQSTPEGPADGQGYNYSKDRSFVVDMSVRVNIPNDAKEDIVPPSGIPLRKRAGSDVLDREDRGDTMDGMNPWSIAKLTAPPRHSRKQRPQDSDENTGVRNMSPRIRRQEPSTRPLTQAKRNMNITDSFRAPGSKIPGGPYRKPTAMKITCGSRMKRPASQTTLSLTRDTGRSNPGSNRGTEEAMTQTALSQRINPSVHLSEEDPRGYFLRRQQGIATNLQNTLQRLKTKLLPLETTPLGSETHSLVLTMDTSSWSLVERFANASQWDSYLRDGEIGCGLHDNTKPGVMEGWVARLETITLSASINTGRNRGVPSDNVLAR